MSTSHGDLLRRQDAFAWNKWRRDNPDIQINLAKSSLVDLRLAGADFSGVDLTEANLSGSDLTGVNLESAQLQRAILSGANLRGAKLNGAHFWGADLSLAFLGPLFFSNVSYRMQHVRFEGANLNGTKFTGIDLSLLDLKLCGADLSRSNFDHCNLTSVNLANANLSDADLRCANLQQCVLDGATLTGARLWETLRAGWSTRGITCEHVYWDEWGADRTHYGPSEFERHHSGKMKIELLYNGGITRFELNTLPALVYRLESSYQGCMLRLSSIEDAPGGTKVCIVIEDSGGTSVQQLREAARDLQAAHLALNLEQERRRQVEAKLDVVLDQVFPRLLAAATSERAVNVYGTAGSVVVGGFGHSVTGNATANDLVAIRELIIGIEKEKAELGVPPDSLSRLEIAMNEILAQLSTPAQNTSAMREALRTVRNVLEGAVGSTVAAAWLPMLSNLLKSI